MASRQAQGRSCTQWREALQPTEAGARSPAALCAKCSWRWEGQVPVKSSEVGWSVGSRFVILNFLSKIFIYF